MESAEQEKEKARIRNWLVADIEVISSSRANWQSVGKYCRRRISDVDESCRSRHKKMSEYQDLVMSERDYKS